MAEDKKVGAQAQAGDAKPKTARYRYRAGVGPHYDLVNNRFLKPGEEIDLTEGQAKAFANKFEKVGEEKPAVAGVTSANVMPPSGVPQDVSAATPQELGDPNPGNKRIR